MTKIEKYEGNLIIRTTEDADKYRHLKEVTGYLYIYSSAKLDALKSVGGYLSIHSQGELIANKLYTGGYSKFKVYDGIPCVVLSSKQKHGVTILSCRKAQIKNQKIIGHKFYIAQQNGNNAHGETIEMAVLELRFKEGSHDISEFKGMSRATVKTPTEWAFVYRMITGACQFGVQDFMQRKGKLKERYTLTEILEETKGAYGYERFYNIITN